MSIRTEEYFLQRFTLSVGNWMKDSWQGVAHEIRV